MRGRQNRWASPVFSFFCVLASVLFRSEHIFLLFHPEGTGVTAFLCELDQAGAVDVHGNQLPGTGSVGGEYNSPPVGRPCRIFAGTVAVGEANVFVFREVVDEDVKFVVIHGNIGDKASVGGPDR